MGGGAVKFVDKVKGETILRNINADHWLLVSPGFWKDFGGICENISSLARVRVKRTERSNRELDQREQRERKNNSGGEKKNS